MPRAVRSVIARLFPNEDTLGPSRLFCWLLIRRRRLPFLLLPTETTSPRVSLALYSAQRWRAKMWRAALTLLLKTPAAAVFHRITLQAGEHSEMLQFLAEQSGLPADQLPTPAIKFGGLESVKSRLVLLVCDAANRPMKVIKVGLDAAGRAATDREADLLRKLPANMLGCVRLTGRLVTPQISAFATDYFPGESPGDDIGMEILFHSWINPEPAVAMESFDTWRELEAEAVVVAPAAWRVLRAALAGSRVRSTLYHGDFAPWNIRAVNSQNLQVFDWERGNLRGFPGWDWFHFIIQTAILARRYSAERVAAEVEELLVSPRFQKYAAHAGIQSVAKPLLLAYLLHHRWVVQPLEGGKMVEEVYAILAAHWNLAPDLADKSRDPAAARPGLWSDARKQLQTASAQLANVFWEPTLTATTRPPVLVQVKSSWPMALFCSLWLAEVASMHYFYTQHVMLLPFYVFPCLLAAWKMNRTWGLLFACLAAPLDPLVAVAKGTIPWQPDVIGWNIIMRFISMQICVFLADRVRLQEGLLNQILVRRQRPADFAGNWAVMLLSWLLFFIIAWGDIFTGPRVSFLPLYLFPIILLTLFFNVYWGTFAAMLGAFVASMDEYASKYNANAGEVFGWNLTMRFLMLLMVVLLLDRLRQGNILFSPRTKK